MKKIILFTVFTLICSVSSLVAQPKIFGKKKKNSDTTMKSTIELIDTAGRKVVVETTKSKKQEAEKLIADPNYEKLLVRIEQLEKAVNSKASKKELRASQKISLDSLRHERDIRRDNVNYLLSLGNTRYKEMLDSISKDARAVAQLTIRANNGDTLAEDMLVDMEKLEHKDRVDFFWKLGFSLLFSAVGLLLFFLFRSNNRMKQTVEDLNDTQGTNQQSFR